MKESKMNQLITGAALVALGLLFLGVQVIDSVDLGSLVLPVMALIFTIWAIMTRKAGLFVPAGVLGGISLGSGLMSLPLADRVADDGGLFMLGFAAGWVLITVLTAIFTSETYWWALIPAAIMTIIGVAILTEGVLLQVLGYINVIWPLILIGIGLYLVFRHREDDQIQEKDPLSHNV